MRLDGRKKENEDFVSGEEREERRERARLRECSYQKIELNIPGNKCMVSAELCLGKGQS